MQDAKYFSHSWELLTRDKGWVKPILVLAIAMFVPVVGPLAVLGYALEWARLSAWGVDAAPKQRGVKIGGCLVAGWRAFVVILVWMLLWGVATSVVTAIIAALHIRLLSSLLSLAITAFGVSLVVNMGVVPNAPDGLVQAIAEKLKRRFGDVKVVFDCSHVAASLALSLVFMHNLGGFGVTTAISALFLGHVINVANKLFAQRVIRAAFGK